MGIAAVATAEATTIMEIITTEIKIGSRNNWH
jgi:hypothetical protein